MKMEVLSEEQEVVHLDRSWSNRWSWKTNLGLKLENLKPYIKVDMSHSSRAWMHKLGVQRRFSGTSPDTCHKLGGLWGFRGMWSRAYGQQGKEGAGHVLWQDIWAGRYPAPFHHWRGKCNQRRKLRLGAGEVTDVHQPCFSSTTRMIICHCGAKTFNGWCAAPFPPRQSLINTGVPWAAAVWSAKPASSGKLQKRETDSGYAKSKSWATWGCWLWQIT